MAATRSPVVELALGPRNPAVTLSRWLYDEIRMAILRGRLARGVRLPATREFAAQYGISRRTAVTVFEQLRDEGYVVTRTGDGTRVSETIPDELLNAGARGRDASNRRKTPPRAPAAIAPNDRLPSRPFNPIYPAVTEFPYELWARLASRRLRGLSVSLLSGGEAAGYLPLREAIAHYLGTSRGVNCTAANVIVTSGVQQGLDLIARTVLKPGDRFWIEDPGYPGALDAITNTGAIPVPVPVDGKGLNVAIGRRRALHARAAYVTPGHQFPLGATMALERRLALLQWARERRAVIIEDDYDSEFRFSGRPVPALQSLDSAGSVILLGTFNKVMFPGLRFGYLVVPDRWLDAVLRLRFQVDRYPAGPDQAILCDFLEGGHFGRHLRRMRELYAARFHALRGSCNCYLAEYLSFPLIEAGLNTPAYLRGTLTGRQAEAIAAAAGIFTFSLDRFALRRRDLRGVLLGFAAFEEKEIRTAAQTLARVFAAHPSRTA